MFEESKNVIIKNFLTLMKDCNVEVLKNPMVENGVFTQKELDNIFSTEDKRHNKRIFFFNIQKKEQRAFGILIQCLRQTKQNFIADLLELRNLPRVFQQQMRELDDTEDDGDTPHLTVQDNKEPRPLKVKVQPSETFLDKPQSNNHLECYSTHSKKRGRFLIINNYDFSPDVVNAPYRNGAKVDNANLITLFKQMGGWDIVEKTNKTANEMEIIIKEFAADKMNSQYDICLVIIMSHGSEKNNETIILGTDGNSISPSAIVKLFSTENCESWRDKPKILLFPVCRGEELDILIRHVTETDSMKKKEAEIREIQPTPVSTVRNIRSTEDIIVGYSTQLGYASHRNPERGSWYIEIFCQKIMNFAHNTTFEHILMLVDQGLKRYRSEQFSMQTSEHSYRGFNKKLYLHPGIYLEDDTIKKFFT